MNLKLFIINLALSYVKKPVIEYYQTTDWDDSDAEDLKDFLNTDTGKKFQKMLLQNSTKCAASLLKGGQDIEMVRAEAKSWLSIVSMLKLLTIRKTLLSRKDLTNDKLDEIFAGIVSNNSRVTADVIYGKR